MQKENRSVWTWLGVFLSGGGIYSALEILWRGYTHWTMAVTGGVCLVLLHGLNHLCARWALVFRCLTGSAIITTMELAVGLLVNRAAGLAVWDYSDMPGNLLGQICPGVFGNVVSALHPGVRHLSGNRSSCGGKGKNRGIFSNPWKTVEKAEKSMRKGAFHA